jgi:hypothetical protein
MFPESGACSADRGAQRVAQSSGFPRPFLRYASAGSILASLAFSQ